MDKGTCGMAKKLWANYRANGLVVILVFIAGNLIGRHGFVASALAYIGVAVFIPLVDAVLIVWRDYEVEQLEKTRRARAPRPAEKEGA